MAEKRLEAQVFGVVQGVGFRMFVRREARRQGLSGCVRNCADGSVEAVAEGTEAQLRELLQALARGPHGSRVDRVESRWLEARGEFAGFEIGY